MSMKDYRTIVVGTDGSSLGGPTVGRAAWLAKHDDADLVIVCAYSPAGRDDTAGAEDALKAWIRNGGRLVAVGDGAAAAAALAEIKTREAGAPDSARGGPSRYLAGREERQRQEWRQEVPGTILPLKLDPAHPLAFGAGLDGRPDETFALHTGSLVFEPAEGLETVPDPANAVDRARELAGSRGAVVVTGSIYLVADLVRPQTGARASRL